MSNLLSDVGAVQLTVNCVLFRVEFLLWLSPSAQFVEFHIFLFWLSRVLRVGTNQSFAFVLQQWEKWSCIELLKICWCSSGRQVRGSFHSYLHLRFLIQLICELHEHPALLRSRSL